MRVSLLFVALVGLVLLLPTPSSAEPDATGPAASTSSGTAEMSYRSYRKWKFRMPVLGFHPVSGEFDFTAGDGGTFGVALEGKGLAVDLDGNGERDVTIEGDAGFVTFERKDADGNSTFKYAARLVGGGGGWMYAASGAMVGKIGDTKIQLIDQDGNGCYADIGKDAMVVGLSRVASFLSEVVNVDGALYAITPSKDGKTLGYAPYDGPVGMLDLKSEFDSNTKLLELVVTNLDRSRSFDLTGAPKSGLAVPAGSYTIHKGTLGLGEARATFVQGRSKHLVVAEGETTALAWGGPIDAEFRANVGQGQVGFDPNDLRYFGRGGEQYISFAPFGKSPEFTIVDSKDQREIAKAIFTGC